MFKGTPVNFHLFFSCKGFEKKIPDTIAKKKSARFHQKGKKKGKKKGKNKVTCSAYLHTISDSC